MKKLNKKPNNTLNGFYRSWNQCHCIFDDCTASCYPGTPPMNTSYRESRQNSYHKISPGLANTQPYSSIT